jgi:hypothetical protein
MAGAAPTKQDKRKVSGGHASDFTIVNSFKLGYRNREDITNLPPGVLIKGSQNVLSNVSERIQIRQGYALDGATSSIASAIESSFDWLTKNNGEVHLRAGFLTSAGNDGKLQYRYVSPSTGAVTWRDLSTGLTTVDYNFAKFWDTTEKLRVCLFVNGTSNIFEWNGAVTEISAAGAATLTKTGDTWLDSGFYTAGTRSVVINGTTYAYTGGENTNTLTGVTPTPVAEPAGSIVHQSVRTTANSSMTDVPATFENGIIDTLNNQIFLGSLTSSAMYISNVNSYTDYSSSTPRQSGEGGVLILDDNLVAFKPQENFMYVSAGQDLWYNVSFELQTSTVGVTYEQVNALPLKTGRQQGAYSQAFVSHMKNNIIMVTNEPTIDMLGRLENYFGTPMTRNISDSIKLDVDSYDFTGGSIFYYKYNIYVAVPQEGLVLVYNLATNSWEAPQTLPITRFYIVDGELYGHSSATSESYKLFTGYADRVYEGFAGYPISATATFSYQNYGSRYSFKKANMFYIEGYINANTILTGSITTELDGCATTRSFTVDGSNANVVCIPSSKASLGKVSLGKQKLGGDNADSIQGLPPKFRVQQSFSSKDFFEVSMSFSILGVNNRFELLAFGLNASQSTQLPIKIRQ